MIEDENRFGRREAVDPRDQDYPVRRLLAAAEPVDLPISRYWVPGPVIDQVGGSCTGASTTGLATASPTRVKPGLIDYLVLYRRAQELDEFDDTPPGEGSSVRAAMKALRELGRISSFHWADDLEAVVEWVLTRGPVVAGTDWLAGMMRPDADDLIRATGSVVGGHAYLIDGANRRTRRLRILNSWGRAWGRNGHAYVGFEDFGLLLAARGEAVAAIESPL